MGHNILFLFPTDVDGPSTTLIVGRAEIGIGADGVWEIDTQAGRTTDVCDALG